jgi:protein gp37
VTDTSIEWCHRPGTRAKTWNPTDGCEVTSPGCANCYAMRMAGRFSAPGRPYHGLVTIAKNKRAIWNGEGRFNAARLALPLSWRSPCTVFVNSMSDLFYDAFTNEQIAAVFGVMAATPQHHYIALTKRAARMRAWFAWVGDHGSQGARSACRVSASSHLGRPVESTIPPVGGFPWPLPNVTIGVSVEDRKHGLPRIDELRHVPAAVRMLSIEPLLEDLGALDLEGVGWAVVGCESGPGARRMDPEWVRSIRARCAAARVPFFLKQARAANEGAGRHVLAMGPGSQWKAGGVIGAPYLDGVQHLAFPEVVP